jgi:hypothetical protein
MRAMSVVAMIDAMPPRSRLCLTFEFDLDGDPVSGIVRAGPADGEAFCGWMALAQTIEVALATARSHNAEPPETGETSRTQGAPR